MRAALRGMRGDEVEEGSGELGGGWRGDAGLEMEGGVEKRIREGGKGDMVREGVCSC